MGKETLTCPPSVPASIWRELSDAAKALVVMQAERIAELERQVAGLQQQLAVLQQQVVELQRRLGQNSTNSSRPPSTDGPGDKPAKTPRQGSGKKRGAQPGHDKAERTLIPTGQCDDVKHHKPEHCEKCGQELSGDDPDPQRKQVVDLPPVRPIVTEHQIHTLTCPCCGTRNCGRLPEHVPRGSFGPEVVATVMLLTGLGRLSHRIMAELLLRLFGLEIAIGQVSRLQRIGCLALQSAREEIAAHVRGSAVANVDETSWRQDGRKAWLWTAVGSLATLFVISVCRSRRALQGVLGAAYQGVVGSDRYSAYSDLPDDRHQFCWAHLLRDFQALIDRGGASAGVGKRLKSAGQELIHQWNRWRAEEITRATFRRHYLDLRNSILDAMIDGQCCRHAKTEDLCRRLFNHNYSLFVFAETDGVAPTNNPAEQSLRRAVIFRKLSFGTESGSGSDVITTTFSVVETCRRLGRDAQTSIREAVEAHFQNLPAPQLITQNK